MFFLHFDLLVMHLNHNKEWDAKTGGLLTVICIP